MGSKSSPTWLRRVHRGERGRLARGEVLSLNEARERRRRHSTQSAGKPRTGGRTPGDERSQGLIAALCLMKFGSTSCHRGRGAAGNATEMTTPVVTLGAEVNPWRAVCAERCKHGSEGGVGKHRSAVRPAPTLPLWGRLCYKDLGQFVARLYCSLLRLVRTSNHAHWHIIHTFGVPQVDTKGYLRPDGSGSGFVKLLRLRRSSGKRVPLPGPTHPLGGPLRTCNFGPTLESLPHLFAVLRRGQQMPSGSEVLGNGAIRGQKSLGMPR